MQRLRLSLQLLPTLFVCLSHRSIDAAAVANAPKEAASVLANSMEFCGHPEFSYGAATCWKMVSREESVVRDEVLLAAAAAVTQRGNVDVDTDTPEGHDDDELGDVGYGVEHALLSGTAYLRSRGNRSGSGVGDQEGEEQMCSDVCGAKCERMPSEPWLPANAAGPLVEVCNLGTCGCSSSQTLDDMCLEACSAPQNDSDNNVHQAKPSRSRRGSAMQLLGLENKQTRLFKKEKNLKAKWVKPLGKKFDPKVNFHPDLQLSAEQLSAVVEADSPTYLKSWCKAMAINESSLEEPRWFPGCKPSDADYWLWKAEISNPTTVVEKQFRTIRPGKTWKVSFKHVYGNNSKPDNSCSTNATTSCSSSHGPAETLTNATPACPNWCVSNVIQKKFTIKEVCNFAKCKACTFDGCVATAKQREHSYLKLAATSWAIHGGDSTHTNPIMLKGPTDRFKWCDISHRFKNEKPPKATDIVNGKQMLRNHWEKGLIGPVISELVVYSLDSMLGLSSVPPGRFLALNSSEFGKKWGIPHLCASPKEWKNYVHKLSLDEDGRIFAWLSVVAPDLRKSAERSPKMPACSTFCSRNGMAAMKALGSLLDCETMGRDEIREMIATHKAGGKAIDHAKETLFLAANPCCKVARSPTKPAVAILQLLTNACDKKTNCFTATFAGEHHSISLDNDCLKEKYSSVLGSQNVSPIDSCAAYPKGLRQHYIARYEALIAVFPNHASPIVAGVLVTMAAHVRRHYDGKVVELVFRFLHDRGFQGAKRFGPQSLWTEHEKNKNKPSEPDVLAKRLYDTFVKCSGF